MAKKTFLLLLFCLVALISGHRSSEQDVLDAFQAHSDTLTLQDSLLFRSDQSVDPTQRQNDALKRITQLLRAKMTANPRPTVPADNPGYIKFRLRIPSPDTSVMMCVTRIRQPIPYLGVAPCKYDNDQFFMYNQATGKLHTFGAERDGYWVPASDGVPAELAAILPDNRKPWILSRDPAPMDPYKWIMRFGDAGRVFLRNMDNPLTVGRCMQVMTDGFGMYLFAKSVKGDTSVCGVFFFMLPTDDVIVGPIYNFKFNTTVDPPVVTWTCATLDPNAVAPTSALLFTDCDPTNLYQRFSYNIITRHLSSAETQDVLFFWWRGPIRAIDLAPTTPGYGWNIPFDRVGPIVANDDRSYSGTCWNTNPITNRVEVVQTCGTYSLIPEQNNMASRQLSRDLQYDAVVVTMARADGTEFCLTIHHTGQNDDANSEISTSSPWVLTMELCDYENFRLDQRFVFASSSCNTIKDARCQGFLRWAGDLSQAVLPANWLTWMLTENKAMVSSMIHEQEYTYTMTFPFAQPGLVTMQRREGRGRQACWSAQTEEGSSLVASVSGACSRFQLVPARSVTSDSNDDQIITYERFDHRWVMSVQTRVVAAGASDQTAYDYFMGDIGRTGIRRMHVIGSGVTPLPNGALQTNTDPNSPNSILFPFMFWEFKGSEYVSGHVYFSVDMEAVQARARSSNKAFVLMSFMRWSGCVVYLTFGGKPGVRCKRDKQVFVSNQIKSWPHTVFDGQVHKASLVATASTPGFISLYIDGQIILNITRSQPWSFNGVSQTMALFYDPDLWQFAALPATLWRFSIVGTNDMKKAQNMAIRKSVDLTSAFQGNPAMIVSALTLTTQWKQCSLIKGTGVHYQGLICTLVPLENGVPTAVPMDVFALGCSRPHCTIGFLPGQPAFGSAFKFMYRPNYPTNFTSENVGDPDLFQDPAQITDGFRTLTLSIGLKYSPDSVTLPTTLRTRNRVGNNLVEFTDFVGYWCRQSCCVTLDGIQADDDEWDAIF